MYYRLWREGTSDREASGIDKWRIGSGVRVFAILMKYFIGGSMTHASPPSSFRSISIGEDERKG